MSELDPITGLPRPADPELSREYVALKPGNYKPRTNLTHHTGKNLTEADLLDYQLTPPLGIGDNQSVVYIIHKGLLKFTVKFIVGIN